MKKKRQVGEAGSEFDIPTGPKKTETKDDSWLKPHLARRGLELNISPEEEQRFAKVRLITGGDAPWNVPGAALKYMAVEEKGETPLNMMRVILFACYAAGVMAGVPFLYAKGVAVELSLVGDYARVAFVVLSVLSAVACYQFWKSAELSQETAVRVLVLLLVSLTVCICLSTISVFLESGKLGAVEDLGRTAMAGIAIAFFAVLAGYGFVRGMRAFAGNSTNATVVLVLSAMSVYASFYVTRNTFMAETREPVAGEPGGSR